MGDTKNKESRTIYLDEELKEVVNRQWEARKESAKRTPYFFPNSKGNGKIRDFRDAWAKACEKAKLGKRMFHDFRRTSIKDMVRSGVPERVAMMISDHKTRSVFDRYNIVSDTDLKEAAAKREAYQWTQTDTISRTIHNINKKRVNRIID